MKIWEKYLDIILSFIFGVFLAFLGFSLFTWQFWVLMILWTSYGIVKMYQKERELEELGVLVFDYEKDTD